MPKTTRGKYNFPGVVDCQSIHHYIANAQNYRNNNCVCYVERTIQFLWIFSSFAIDECNIIVLQFKQPLPSRK